MFFISFLDLPIMLSLKKFKVMRGGKEIVKGIDCDFHRGQIHVILGANGSGKTTMANGMIGIYPSQGKVILDGVDISDFTIYNRAKMGLTIAFQEPARFEGLTVKDYLLISSKDKSIHDVESALKMVGLPKHILYQEMDESLSGGERKRVELAAVYLMKPKYAILDEPDSGIDVRSFRKIADIILALRDSGAGVILITHSQEMISLGDVATIMADGRIVGRGDPTEIRELFLNSPCPI